MENTQGRKWFLTLNNPKEHGYEHEALKQKIHDLKSVTYYCLSDEIGKEGTFHTHVFIYSSVPIRFRTIKTKFESAHIEKAYGSCIENRQYILKEGKYEDTEKAETRVEGSFEEEGVLPSEKAEKEPDYARIIAMFDAGLTVNQVLDEFPKYALQVSHLEELMNHRRSYKSESLRDVNVTYIYGATGTGKTYSIYQNHMSEDICRITNYGNNGLFDNYHGQKVLVFDEFHSQINLPQMLTYLDIYPVSLPARYYNRRALYSEVYILSNIPLNKQYSEIQRFDSKTWEAFIRRIKKVYKQISYGNRIEVPKGGIYDENPFVN